MQKENDGDFFTDKHEIHVP